MIESGRLFGCDVACLTLEQTVSRIVGLVELGQVTQHISLNVLKVSLMRDDPELAATISRCGLVSADGQSIVWAGRLLGVPVPERVAGIDLMMRLLGEAERRAWRVYFLGARDEVLSELIARLRDRYPGLVIAGSRNGYFSRDEEHGVVTAIAEAGAHLLFVGMPSPKKEDFVARNLAAFGVHFAMGVGGAFDVEAGRTRRAPGWVRHAGLEWLYRVGQEPRRMCWRYLVGNARFALACARELSVARKRGRGPGRLA